MTILQMRIFLIIFPLYIKLSTHFNLPQFTHILDPPHITFIPICSFEDSSSIKAINIFFLRKTCQIPDLNSCQKCNCLISEKIRTKDSLLTFV